MIRPAAALLALIVGQPVSAGSLDPFAGTFKGSGPARIRPSEPAETTRCRMVSTLSDEGRTLKQAGQCAVPGHKVNVGGALHFNPNSGVLSGSWRDVATGRNGQVSGRFSGEAMRLTVIIDNPDQGEPPSYAITVTPTADGYRFVSRAPGVAEPLADLTFEK